MINKKTLPFHGQENRGRGALERIFKYEEYDKKMNDMLQGNYFTWFLDIIWSYIKVSKERT